VPTFWQDGGAHALHGEFLRFRTGDEFDLEFALIGAFCHSCAMSQRGGDILAAYVNTYLKEELQAEG